MGPQAAINAVFYNQLQAIEDPDERARRTEELRTEYQEEIDILHLASELVIDAVVPAELRGELAKRYAAYAARERATGRPSATRHAGLDRRRRHQLHAVSARRAHEAARGAPVA